MNNERFGEAGVMRAAEDIFTRFHQPTLPKPVRRAHSLIYTFVKNSPKINRGEECKRENRYVLQFRFTAYSILTLISAHAMWTAYGFWLARGNTGSGSDLIATLRTGILLGRIVSILAPIVIVALVSKAVVQFRLGNVTGSTDSIFLSIVLLLGIISWAAIQTVLFGQKGFGILGW